MQWSADSKELAFVSTSRDHKREDLRVADARTGAVRDVLAERAETFFESGQGRVNWRYLPQTKEVLWFSRKDDWGHLYLHDATTGFQKNRITTGDGNVTQVLRVDEAGRTIYFQGVGKETGRDPYFRQFYKIGFDGKGQTLLTPEDGDHAIDLVAVGQGTSWTPIRSPTCRRCQSCATWSGKVDPRRSKPPTSRSSSQPAGSRRCHSRSRRVTARPTFTG